LREDRGGPLCLPSLSKVCLKCNVDRPLSDWAKDSNTKDNLQTKCKQCQRQYRLDNKQKHIDYAKDYRDLTRDKASAYSRQWRIDNPDHPIDKGKDAAKTAKRRCSKLEATPPWVSGDHLKRIESIYIACSRVSERSGVPHHVDHIVPLQGVAVKGLHVGWNLRIIPASMNLQKGNHYDEDE
jgi:hypothetical protein